MPPSRRPFLRTCGSVVGLSLSLAGCLSSTGEDRERATTTEAPIQTTVVTDTATTAGGTEKTTTDTAPPEVGTVDPAEIDRGVPLGLQTDVEWSDPPFRAFAVGQSPANVRDNRPHHVWVWNGTDEVRTVELALTTEGTTLLEDSFEVEPHAALAVVLRDPRDYELTIRSGELSGTASVERSRFDCNQSATDVIVNAAEILSGTITQSMACGTTTA